MAVCAAFLGGGRASRSDASRRRRGGDDVPGRSHVAAVEAIECITDVVINEVIHQCSVRCCVTIVAADGRLIVPFKQVRAPLATVASIVSSIQEVLPREQSASDMKRT